jgi:sulfide:quinone oxidoreductase
MASPSEDPGRLRVVVAGGGVAGLETVVALRGLVGQRVALTLVAPQDDFAIRAFEVLEPFGLGPVQRFALAALAADLDVDFVRDAVVCVEERVAGLASGDGLAFDALVLATGASPYPAYEHGVCFDRAHDADAVDELVADVRAGGAGGVAVVVPPGCTWTLPAYELALTLAAPDERAEVTLVTPESEPLEAFGAPGAELARAELAASDVTLLENVRATVPRATVVQLGSRARVTCDRVVHLPLWRGPGCAGVRCDADGFILVDDAFQVRGRDDVYAVGDATSGALKQGGLAGQQADVVAERIAWRVGAEHAPRPYRPVLRGLLRTPRGPRYLRAEPPGGAHRAEVSDTCLWWPPSKVAARWLTPCLAARGVGADGARPLRRLPTGGLSASRG